ncbi:MAG: DUF1499 domain-containing protein [Desulfovibrio sp.]
MLGCTLFSCAAAPVQGLGVHDGGLAACPSSPNCVHSGDANPDRRIEGLPANGEVDAVMDRVARLVEARPRVRIVERDGAYLHAEFRSRVFGFVDDMEFLYLPDQGVVQMRSAARSGWWDFGVNRDRARLLREEWLKG